MSKFLFQSVPQTLRNVRFVSSHNSTNYDVVVVGGGIVGIASARELKKRHQNLRVCLVEKEPELGRHQTGHNSGVIHTGMYYAPGSLKAKLCVQGMHLMYEYLDEHKIPYKKLGKLIVATNEAESKRLMNILDRGIQNKSPDLEIVDAARIRELEPYCRGVKALWSPHTGIVDFKYVAKHLAQNFEKMGGEVRVSYQVNSFARSSNPDYPVRITSKTGTSVQAKYILTCAGLYSDKLAALSGGKKEPQIIPFRGEYLLLNRDKCHMVRGNIYPVPDPRFPFLGVHFTPRINGEVWIGPNAVLALKREGYKWSDVSIPEIVEAVKFRGLQRMGFKYLLPGIYEMLKSASISYSVKDLQKYIKDITVADVTRGPAGVRAQAMDIKGTMVDDFVFELGQGEIGKCILHTRNAPSPGATGSLAIAKMIADKFGDEFKLPTI